MRKNPVTENPAAELPLAINASISYTPRSEISREARRFVSRRRVSTGLPRIFLEADSSSCNLVSIQQDASFISFYCRKKKIVRRGGFADKKDSLCRKRLVSATCLLFFFGIIQTWPRHSCAKYVEQCLKKLNVKKIS